MKLENWVKIQVRFGCMGSLRRERKKMEEELVRYIRDQTLDAEEFGLSYDKEDRTILARLLESGRLQINLGLLYVTF